MSRPVNWTDAAIKDLGRLDKKTATRVDQAIQRFADTGQGDVKRLKGQQGELRLRVGKWRVRFTANEDGLSVFHVLPRGKAYRRR